MIAAADLKEAKRLLSARLLHASRQWGVVRSYEGHHGSDVLAQTPRNIHGVGIGPKIVMGQPVNEVSVRVYVARKAPQAAVPGCHRIPSDVDGIPIDVVEAPPPLLLIGPLGPGASRPAASDACTSERTRRQRPVVAGISAAHYRVRGVGTIAYFCRSLRRGDDREKVYVLSDHVFGNVNAGLPGDPIYQPGPGDNGNVTDHFADLQRAIRIDLEGGPNNVDAAIAELLPGTSYRPEVCGIGQIAGTTCATGGMIVRKHGRTTGYTEGTVAAEPSHDAVVSLDLSDPTVIAFFVDLVLVEPRPRYPALALPGDSGSMIVTMDDPKAIGIYFAGSPTGSYGLATPIDQVLTSLEIELV
jgi:hypothetical protein